MQTIVSVAADTGYERYDTNDIRGLSHTQNIHTVLEDFFFFYRISWCRKVLKTVLLHFCSVQMTHCSSVVFIRL